MSGAADEAREALAGEYALGVLEGDALVQAERLMADDAAFAAVVRDWREILSPLARLAAPVPPPADLWRRIELAAGLADNVVPMHPVGIRRAGVWKAVSVGALALAASLAAFIVVRPPPPPSVAVLAPMQGASPVLLAVLAADGVLTVRPNGAIAVPSDRDLELWSLAKGETRPASLGVLPAGGRRLSVKLAAGTQLLVSLEPKGGSPTGQPTGAVLYGGTVTALD